MYVLRDYQQDAHDKTVLKCRETNQPLFHSHSVGAGKTLLIAFLTKHVVDKGGRVLVLARQSELIEQNGEDFRAIGGKYSTYSQSLGRKSTYYPAVFGTEGTVARALNGEFKTIKFSALLIDECHHVDWQDVVKDEPETQYGKIIKHVTTVNPDIRIVGYTGSPFRGSESIKGEFWKHLLSEVGTYELVSKGFLVPPVFGFGDDERHYEALDKYEIKKVDGAQDFSSKELAAMGRAICKEQTKTQAIMEEVIERTRDRLGVLITCASKKHCEQVSECLPNGSWGIVTDSTSAKERKRILDGAKDGSIKYVMQIGCLTTGVNVPYWDTCVVLRRIGSLTLLIQLIGRVLRTLKPYQIDIGIIKDDALILDYTDTLEAMGDIYDHPITDAAAAQAAKKEGKTQECPTCMAENGEFAVRCIGVDPDSPDGRCEHFFKSTMCLSCNADNAPSAKTCRCCGAILIDPNDQLKGKAYSDADYKPVISMQLTEGKSGGMWVTYRLDSTYHKDGEELPEVAKEFIDPLAKEQFKRAKWWQFVKQHIQAPAQRRMLHACSTVEQIIGLRQIIDTPEFITHRVNGKGFSIINRKKFASGREETIG